MGTTNQDTWGIPGPTFLLWFTIAIAAGVLVNLAVRWAVRSVPARPMDGMPIDRLDPESAGYLAGGPTQASYTALAGLRRAGLVEAAGAGMVVAVGRPVGGLTRLQSAVLAAASRPVITQVLPTRAGVREELAAIRDRLRTVRLLPSRGGVLAVRWSGVPLIALLGLGIARIVAGIGNGKPVTNLVWVTIALLFIALCATGFRVQSAAGRQALRRLRDEYTYLSPQFNPSWQTYGVGGAAMGVALFGTVALFAGDQEFARAAGVSPPSSTDGGGAGYVGDGGSSSDSGGSSCGGGGGCSG